MERTILQGLLIVALFAGVFYSLNEVDWMSMLDVKENTTKTEEKLGELFWDVIRDQEKENTDPFIINTIDSLLIRLCDANDIRRSEIRLHIIEKDEVNAYAMPGGHLVVYTGLIKTAENPGEVAGVLAHEVAHLQLNHVMKKLIKEFGLSALISIATGDNPQVIIETVRMLSSTAFDRSLEKEADIKAADYMMAADMNPEHFADFLFRLASENKHQGGYDLTTWISTHPDSEERAHYVIEYSGDNKINETKVISDATWDTLLEKLNGAAANE